MDEKKTAHPGRVDSAKVIQVIQTVSRAGNGSESNPNRFVTAFWSLDGELLAVNDPISSSEELDWPLSEVLRTFDLSQNSKKVAEKDG